MEAPQINMANLHLVCSFHFSFSMYLTEIENTQKTVDVTVANELASSFAVELATVGKQLSELNQIVVNQQKLIVDQNAVLEKLMPQLSTTAFPDRLALTGPNATSAVPSMALVPSMPQAHEQSTGLMTFAPNASFAAPQPAFAMQNQLSELLQVKQQLAFSQQIQVLQSHQDLSARVSFLEQKIQVQMMQGCPLQQPQFRGS
jgi:hypothetical protein